MWITLDEPFSGVVQPILRNQAGATDLVRPSWGNRRPGATRAL